MNSGTIKWVVTESGELVITPATVRCIEISHAVLSNGRGVVAAGQAEVAGVGGRYIGISITNHSGHFQPSVETLSIGRAAFERWKIVFPGP